MSLYNPEQAGTLANHIIANRLIAQLCPLGGTFLDVGAQHGSVFAAALRNDRTLTVIAAEAEPAKARKLKEAFPKCRVFDLAIGEREGTATFYLNPEASGYNSLVPSTTANCTPIEVRLARLDDLLPNTRVDVLKVDIEGAELGAFRGGEQLITSCRPLVMFECVMPSINALGYSASLLWHWFNDRDFRIFSPDRLAHTAPGMEHDTFIDAQFYPFRSHNYFAVHDQMIDETRDRAREILGVV